MTRPKKPASEADINHIEDTIMSTALIDPVLLRQALLDARVPSEATMHIMGKIHQISDAYNTLVQAQQSTAIEETTS